MRGPTIAIARSGAQTHGYLSRDSNGIEAEQIEDIRRVGAAERFLDPAGKKRCLPHFSLVNDEDNIAPKEGRKAEAAPAGSPTKGLSFAPPLLKKSAMSFRLLAFWLVVGGKNGL